MLEREVEAGESVVVRLADFAESIDGARHVEPGMLGVTQGELDATPEPGTQSADAGGGGLLVERPGGAEDVHGVGGPAGVGQEPGPAVAQSQLEVRLLAEVELRLGPGEDLEAGLRVVEADDVGKLEEDAAEGMRPRHGAAETIRHEQALDRLLEAHQVLVETGAQGEEIGAVEPVAAGGELALGGGEGVEALVEEPESCRAWPR
jgi:hypothetical protein